MMNKKVLYILMIIILTIPVIFYVCHFYNGKISDKNEDWGNFGDYLNGFFTPLIALVGILVTYYLGLISEKRNETNLNVEKLKHRPILHIGYFDAEDHMEIFIENKGNGPLTVKEYKLINEANYEIKERLFDCLPTLINDDYDNYTGNITGIVLKANENFQLFLYEKDNEPDVIKNKQNRDLIRKSLKNYKLTFTYTDVYDDVMPKVERSLIWFGRNL